MIALTLSQMEAAYEENGQFIDLEARPYNGGWILVALSMAHEYSAVLASARKPSEPRRFASLDSVVTLIRANWNGAELSVQIWEGDAS